jgi:hypothetical protein
VHAHRPDIASADAAEYELVVRTGVLHVLKLFRRPRTVGTSSPACFSAPP